ncbi:MAG: hypothetical protein D6798_11710 [Deltaproteobacteria bacterium]|nr:MAG: hypothetical protein D6798_11710 [Deltaproteobacteria bacterium]
MNRPPLGKVCIELGLLDDDAVERILRDMREHGQGRFGELAVGLNLLSEQDLARALAHQFDVTLLSPERVAELEVPPDLVAMIPARLMRNRVILPTFFDPDRRLLTLVTSDPTDLPALQAVQRHARADHLRIFVAARSALAARLDQVLPVDNDDDPSTSGAEVEVSPGGTVVLEPDVELAAALRRLERVEGGRTQIVSDPEQVTSLLLARLADRVLYREQHAGSAAPYLPMWRKARPDASIAAVRGFSPGRREAVAWPDARDFYHQLLLWVLSVGERQHPGLRHRLRTGWTLARELGAELDLAPERLEAVSLAAMLQPVGGLTILHPEPSGSSPLDGPVELLSRFSPPFDLAGLYAAAQRRLRGSSRPGDDLGLDILVLLPAVLDRDLSTLVDAADLLPSDLHVHPRVLAALSRVLQRRALRAQLLTGGRRHARVVVATSDAIVATDLDQELTGAGFTVVVHDDPGGALAAVRALTPAAVVLAEDLGTDENLRILAEIRRDAQLAETPTAWLATSSDGLPPEALSLKPDHVSHPPHDLGALIARLRIATAHAGVAGPRSTSITGDSQLLPLQEVVDLLRAGRQTATVRLVAGEDDGRLQVIDGHLSTARLGRRAGRSAWRLARELPELRYAVTFGPDEAALDDDTISVGPG